MIKKISIFIVIIALIIIVPINTYATIFDSVIDTDLYDPGTPEKSEDLTNISNTIIGAVHYIGIFLSVGTLMIIGIKYMMGSIEEKATYKETMMPYIIGAILLFGGVNIIKIIYNIANQII